VSFEVLQARYLAARDTLLGSARDRRPISRRMVLEAVEHIETYIDAIHLLLSGEVEDES
jgi:hypothetical protein